MQRFHFSHIDLVQRFREMRLLVIGDSVLDTYLEGNAVRLSRDGPIPVIRKTQEQRLLGGAANVAANLHALGAQVSFVSVVGQDIAGALIREALRARQIDEQWVLVDPTLCTPHKLRILANEQPIARFDEGEGSTSQYSSEVHYRLLQHLESLYPLCDAVVLSDYGYGLLPQYIEHLQHFQQTFPRTMLVDAQNLAPFRTLPCTIVTPNYQEALRFSTTIPPYQIEDRGPANLEHVADLSQRLSSVLASEYVAITLAEGGVLFRDRQGQTTHLPAHPVALPHDVGAGDSFASGLALALAAGGSMRDAIQIGIDAAGIAVTKPRTAVVSYQELLQKVSVRLFTAERSILPEDTYTHLMHALAAARREGKTIVLTNGIFDVLHVGHVNLLRQAKSLGDLLVVGVNDDQSTQRLKGPGRPINIEQDRLALVDALDMVDYSFLLKEDTANNVIRQFQPDVYVKGGDYTDTMLPEASAVQEIGGTLVILPLVGTMRTSTMIERIKRQEAH